MALRQTRGTAERAARRHRWEPMTMVAVGSVVALVVTLVPLLVISAYNHSYADDWHYGVWAHLSLQETGGNILVAIGVAAQQVGKAWMEWQGTYSAIFLMALEPSVFGEQWYVLAAPIVIGCLVAGTFYFARVLLVDYLHAPRSVWVSVSCAILVVTLLLQPSPVEGLYWFNSAVYYTVYHAALLALVGVLLKVVHPARRGRCRGLDVWACVLAVFIAGGNFVDALVALEFGVALLAWLLHTRSRRSVDVFPAFAGLVLGVTVSMVAPGNSVRQQTQFPDAGAGVVDTIVKSFWAAFTYLSEWTQALVVLAALFVLPLAVRAVSGRAASGLRYPLPGLVSVASLAVLGTSFTPTFWSMGTVGPGRVQNARFDLFVILVMVNLFWWCGWVVRHRRELVEGPAMVVCPPPTPRADACVLSARNAARACGLVALVFVLVVCALSTDEKSGETLTSVSAARSLMSGQAVEYDRQVTARLDQLQTASEAEDAADAEVDVTFYTDAPKVLFMGDVRDNMGNYINYRLAQWYGLKSVIGVHATATATGSSS